MVKDTGASQRDGGILPVNEPETIAVDADDKGKPLAVKMRTHRKVEAILSCWRIDEEWWREKPVSRLYFTALLDDGVLLTLFRDLITGEWYRQSYE